MVSWEITLIEALGFKGRLVSGQLQKWRTGDKGLNQDGSVRIEEVVSIEGVLGREVHRT